MRKRIKPAMMYAVTMAVCVLLCTKGPLPDSSGEYTSTMEMYSYQLDYTDVYSPLYPPAENAVQTEASDSMEKTAYLTFDDGPTERTAEILDILQENDIKATFFVIRTKDKYMPFLQRAAEEGHTIGVHSASHEYRKIYATVDAYLQDFSRCYEYIENATGCTPTIFRFPGGSVNNYNSATRKDIVQEMLRRGFVYFDWNVESGDSGKLSAEQIFSNVIKGCKGKSRAVIIMHDSAGKKTTVEALGKIIAELKNDGWVFRPLTNRVKPVIFRMK